MLPGPRALGASLKVLTFNAWLLDIPVYPFGLRRDISEDMSERIKRMPQRLAETQADVIVLQEVWSQASKDALIKGMKERGYPYAAYTKASNWFLCFQMAMGDGLLIVSKFPISDRVIYHDFAEATQSLERFASKSVMKVMIKHPSLGYIDLYASHLGAVDFENGDYNESKLNAHEAQLVELSEFMRTTRSHPITLLAADLNMHYKKWDHAHGRPRFVNEFSESYLRLKRSSCGGGHALQDTYLLTHQKTARDDPDYTFDQQNGYVKHGYYDSLPSEVEDYVFVCDNEELRAESSDLVFKGEKLSDHYGVVARFQWTEASSSPIVSLATSGGQSLASKAKLRK